MHYVEARAGEVIEFEDAFPDWDVYQHGNNKVGFGEGNDSVDNPTSVCVKLNSGERLLEVADWSDGSSSMGATMGGNRDVVVARVPFARNGDDGVLGVLKYRQGAQPSLYVKGETVEGGSNRFSSFVSETGAADEDPKPRSVRSGDPDDPHGGEEYFVNRNTGQAAHTDYYVHVYRIDHFEGEANSALTLQVSGHTPKTDTVYPADPAAANFCPNCGAAF